MKKNLLSETPKITGWIPLGRDFCLPVVYKNLILFALRARPEDDAAVIWRLKEKEKKAKLPAQTIMTLITY